MEHFFDGKDKRNNIEYIWQSVNGVKNIEMAKMIKNR